MAQIICFLKFGSEENIRDLYDNGTIYMNTLNSFRIIEDQELRGDLYEGVSRIWNFPAGQFTIDHLNYTGNYQSFHLRESYENINGNIFSLYCISSNGWSHPDEFSIDSKVARFGTHFLLIKDNPLFLKLIREKLDFLGLKYREGFIDYYDKDTINDEISVFQKPLEFEYQKEFRFFVHRKELTPLIFKIGSLKEIAEVCPIKYISEIKLEKTTI